MNIISNKDLNLSGIYPIISNSSKNKIQNSLISTNIPSELSANNLIFLSINSDYSVLSSTILSSNNSLYQLVGTDNSNIYIQDYSISKYKTNNYNNTTFNFLETNQLTTVINNVYYRQLSNDSNRFFIDKTIAITDLIIPYKIKKFIVNISSSTSATLQIDTEQHSIINIVQNIQVSKILSNYIPKDLHQAILQITFLKDINNNILQINGFYNGKIIILLDNKNSQLYLSNTQIKIYNCDYIQFKKIRAVYTYNNFLYLYNVKYCRIEDSTIFTGFLSSYIQNLNNQNIFTYKNEFIPNCITNNNLSSIGNLIYTNNSNLLLKNICIQKQNQSDYPSMISFIADFNSKIVSDRLSCDYSKCSAKIINQKRPILFYSCRNSRIDASNTSYRYNDESEYSIDFDYNCSNYPISSSILYGYATVGSIFNHNHSQHFIYPSETNDKNSISSDLPIGSIYSIMPNLNNVYLSSNTGTSISNDKIYSYFLGSFSGTQLKFGLTYPNEQKTIKEIYNQQIYDNFNENTDYLFPISNITYRLNSIFCEDLFFCQKYYPITVKNLISTTVSKITSSNWTTVLGSQEAENIQLSDFNLYNNFFTTKIFKYCKYPYYNKVKNNNKIRTKIGKN